MPKSTISTKKYKMSKLNDSLDFVKILEIYFTEDLGTTGIYDWNTTQIEKQTQLVRRNLS